MKRRFQRRLLNDFLKNLHLKFLAENPEQTILFSTFARPAHFKFVNFTSRNSCLCVNHQNIPLKLKVLKSKGITTFRNPDVFIKHYDTNSITKKIKESFEGAVTYEVWKKVVVEVDKNDTSKEFKKMKLITEEKDVKRFACVFQNEATESVKHVYRIGSQFKAQKELRSNLHQGHFYVHMDFAEDYRCRAQHKVQSAYWNTSQVTLHRAVIIIKMVRKSNTRAMSLFRQNHDMMQTLFLVF